MAKRKKSKYTFTGLVLIFNIIALLLISIYFQKEIVKYFFCPDIVATVTIYFIFAASKEKITNSLAR
jgi:hypothetical protein